MTLPQAPAQLRQWGKNCMEELEREFSGRLATLLSSLLDEVK